MAGVADGCISPKVCLRMPDFLLELLSEEIPARMQEQAAIDLERIVVGLVSEGGLLFEGVKRFSGPRRLAVVIKGLPTKQPDVTEEKKGPRINAPPKAIDGFIRSAGVTLQDCVKRDDGKGEFYVAVIARGGRPTSALLKEELPPAIEKLAWPKSMRWPLGGNTRWVRPLHGILCTLDGETIGFSLAGVTSSNTTYGHRFLSSGPIRPRRADDYQTSLRAAYVEVDSSDRKVAILHGARQKAFALGLELIEDTPLLEEVAGLAEWPVVLVGRIEDEFMELPPEILQTSMRNHQKYFSLRDAEKNTLANRFVLVANMVTADNGKEITKGNERVLRARLNDAKFFWDQDRKTRLEERVKRLASIVYHAGLGTQFDRTARIKSIARTIAEKVGADTKKTERAALLCKADLTCGVVAEFPELQGVMGRYYATHDGEDPAVAIAIEQHYKPSGPSDEIPAEPVSIAVALADKIDALVSFFRIGERPTGSGDPYALRRAALGVLRIILEKRIRLDLLRDLPGTDSELLEFFVDRLGVILRDRGIGHDVLKAVFSVHRDADLVRLVALVGAVQEFLASKDGQDLIVAYRRAANILRAEEKRDADTYVGEPVAEQMVDAAEKSLFGDLTGAEQMIRNSLACEQFTEAMRVMAKLRLPVDAFFEAVKVNSPDRTLRRNRLLLLSKLRTVLHLVADFSKIEG